MIPRYTPKDFAAHWSARSKYETWFDVEIAACRAMETAKLVPAGTADAILPVKAKLDADRIDEIEKETRHDVIAFLTHVEELAGPPARFLHRGLTSSDILDTSFAILLRDAGEQLLARLDRVLDALTDRMREHASTPALGRSHGIGAEPVTFGLQLAGHHAELTRGYQQLAEARKAISVGKLAGAVGTYAHLTPAIEQQALSALGLAAETVPTQVVARDRHAVYFAALALVAAAIERLATNVRHWQRTEVGEAEEFFQSGQKGSSAMPHKRNPVLSENLTGLARMVRSTVIPALENVALWHERDISHSSVERMIGPDATTTLAFMLDRCEGLVRHLVVYPDRLRANLDRVGCLWASEGVLLALVNRGLARQAAYGLVQRNAMRAFQGDGDFIQNLCEDEEIRTHLDEAEIRATASLDHALSHITDIIERSVRARRTIQEELAAKVCLPQRIAEALAR